MDLKELDAALDKVFAYGPSKKDAMKEGDKPPSKPLKEQPTQSESVTKHAR